ncbi:beta strand repeat-containing protein [Mesorhizobium sp. 14Argb]
MRAGYRRSRIARQLWKTTALTTLALGLSSVFAHADPDGLWQPQIRAIVGADDNGGNAALEGFIPIKQTAESVLFLDVRAKHDFKDASGQDIGLGIRRIVNPDLMLGGYAYINLENYNSTQFTAATLGVEAITPNFDAHVNVFVPIKGDSTDHTTGSTLSMVSNQLIEQISVLDHRDYAAWGIEGEIGAQVPVNLPDKHSLRLDIGGYHFEDPHGDDGSVTGAKAGFEYTIGDVFGSGTELVFAGEVRNDNRDDTQFAGSVRLNIPFNPGHGSDTTGAIGTDPVYPVSEGLRKRVNERVRGDIGVRVQSQDKIGGSTTRVAINAATNAAFGKFYFADGGLAGAGTQADPTTLDDAVTKAGNGGFVVALGGNGNLTTAGVTLANGQTVIGGGQSVTAKLSGGGTATFNLGGSNGTIQGTNVANNVITLGTGNTLNGITITGGANGIFGNNATGTTLTNVTVTGAGGNGAAFTGNSTNVSGSNFTATGNGLDGLHIEDNGTYNFTGTTLLQGNHDDGLDITGQGTYTFATVNALDNTDRGITVQGTSSGGSFTTTGGTVSGNGGMAVFIDPITAHVVLDSISQTGGTSGVVLDHVSGSFTVNGSTMISNTTGAAIQITDSPATIRFGDINITNPGAGGMSFSGVNAAVVAGNIVISGLGVGSGLDFSGSQTNFTAQSLNITGPGAAGTIGIDLADATGDATIIITNGGSISGVDTGVRFGIAGSLAHSANAEFSFGGGSIAGSTASLDARGLNQTLGHYAFGSTTFNGPQLFDPQNVIFVGAVGSSGDGSSTSSLLAIDLADANTQNNAIFVLVNEGSPIDAAGGFSLSDGQTLASFGNGRSFSLGGIPVNITGDNIQHDQVVSDPGGGAATLTNSGAGDVVTAANNSSLLDFNISGGAGNGVHGSGVSNVTISGVNVSGMGLSGVAFDGTNTVTATNLNSSNNTGGGLSIQGDGTYAFNGTTTLSGNGTNGLYISGNGTYGFETLNAENNGSSGVNALSNGTGKLTTTGGTISGNAGSAFLANNIKLDVALDTLSQSGGQTGINIAAASGNFSVTGTTTVSGTTSDGVSIGTSSATIGIANLATTSVAGADVKLSGNTGTIGIGGTITNSGTGDGVVVSGGSAAITVSADISSSATAPGTAVKVDGISGGSVTFSGTVTSTGTGRLFEIGSAAFLSGGTISFTGPSLSATGGGGASAIDLIGTAKLNVTAPLSITNAASTGLVVGSVDSTASATFGAVTVTGAGPGIAIANTAGSVTFGTTQVTLGSAANVAGIVFVFTNADVSFGTTTVTMGAGANQSGISFATASADASFGTTTVTMGAGANQTGINFNGAFATADFGVTHITGTGDLTSRGIDLSSTQADKTITFARGSSISNVGVGVELSSGGTTATSANANFTFGDGTSADGLQSSISAAAGGYTVNTVGLNPALGNYNFNDVAFTGSAHLTSAGGGVTMVSQNGGVIAAGTDGLSQSVTTISVAQADALLGTQTFAFVGTVDLSGTPFTLDSGQSITGFGNNTSINVSGTIQPVNVQGNLGATGGNVTGNEGVVTGTGDFLHLLGSNQVRNTAFDFSGASGSVLTVDQSAGGFNNAGGIVIEGVTVSNVAAGSTAFKVAGLDSNLSITNNNVNVAGTLLDVNGGTGNITVTRGTLPNSATPGTLTGGGISIANRTGGLVNFTDTVTVGGTGVSLTGNTGSTVTFADLDITTSGATAFSASGGGTVNVTTGTINATNAQAVALDGITAGINFASTSATFASGNGIDLQNLSGTASFGTGTLTNTGAGTSFNVGSATNLSGGNADISYGGTIASNGTGAAVSIQELTGGSVTLSGNLTDNNAAVGGNIVVAGIDNGTAATVTFSGTSKQISSGATDAVSLIGNPDGTLDFTGGGLVITTASGTGFKASTFGVGTVSVTGSGNTITTTTGTALDLANATVGAGGVTFDSISVNGAATGVSLNNVSGGAVGLGVVNLQNITSRGIDISGTLGAAVNATSINIGLNAINAVGLDLNGATLGASNITTGDFDVDGGSFAGTIGIDMAGTTGTGTIQLGDTVNNNPAGQTSTIANVGYGVQFSSTTNAQLVFGDGQGPAESSIATTGGQVIHTVDTLPTSGDYNFNDVNFSGDTANLSSISVYYVDLDGNNSGTGDGSLANPGSLAQAQASTANVIVLIDKNVNGSQETIDLSGTSYQLHDGQVLLAFKSGDAAIDVSQLGVDASGGASAAFHFTTIQNTPIISAPASIDTLRPVLQSNNATSVINFATSGTGTFTGGIENLIVRNIGSGAGVSVNATAASSFFLRNNDIAAGGSALDFATTGAPANTLVLSIDGNTLKSTGSALAASFVGQNINATDNSIAIRTFAGNKVIGGTGGGIAFNNVRFDSDGIGGTVSAVSLGIGTSPARVQGNGLSFTNTSGTFDVGALALANAGGTGVIANTKTTTFTLNSSSGLVNTLNGTAFDLDPLTVNMTLSGIISNGGANGIIFDGVAGTFTITGVTTLNGKTGFGIDAINTNTGTFNFNTVTIDSHLNTGGGIHVASGTLNVTGLANIDTSSGVGLSQSGGTTNFNNGLTIDTTTGTGITGTGGTMNILATAASQTVNSTGGQAINLSGVVASIGLDSTSSAGGVNNVSLTSVGGTVDLGGGALSGASGASFNVVGGTATVTYGGNITQANNAALVSVSGGNAGSLTFDTGTLSASNGTGLQFDNADGTYNFNGTTTLNGGDAGVDILNGSAGTFTFGTGTTIISPSGTAFNVDTSSASVTYSGNITQANSAALVAITGHSGGTITFQTGTLSATNGNGLQFDNADGIYNFNGTTTLNGGDAGIDIVNGSGGTFSFGTGTTITSPSGTAFNVDTGTANVTYSGNITQASNAAMVAITGHSGGTITFQTGTLSATGGTGLQFDNADGTYNFNGPTTLNGGDAGVDILNGSGGTFGFGTGTSITSPSGTAFNVAGGAASITYAGTITQATAGQRIIAVADTTGGAVSFTTAVANGLNATGGTGILIDGAAGNVTVNNASLTGTRGITILGDAANNATGTFTFNNVAIDTTAGATNHAFVVDGDQGTPGNNDVSAVVNLNNVDITNPGGNVVNIQGMGGGSVTFNSASTITRNDGGLGIVATSNAGGTIAFGGALTLTTSVNNAVDLSSNTGATFNFTGGLAITTTTGIGFNATGGGTINVTGSNSVQTATGQILNWNGMIIGGSGATFTSLQSTGSVTGDGVNLTGVSGGTFNGGAVTVAGTTGVGSDGIEINGSSAAFNFTSATIAAAAGNGIFLSGANGAVTFSTVAINNTGQAGIRIDNNTNAVAVNGGSIGATNDPTGNGVDINGGTGSVTIAASVTKTSTGNIVNVSGRTAGTVVFSGSLSATGGFANGIDVSGNSGTAVINFSNATKTLTTGANTAVNLTGNTGATINFTGNGLVINTASGTGFNATGGGTVTVQGTGNTIVSTTGTALNIANTTIGASNVTFQSISANGAVNGIVLNNTGTSGGLIVTGSGNTALGGNSSGGTIQNTTGDAILLTNTKGPSFTNINIQNAANSGIKGTTVTNFTLANSTINNVNTAHTTTDGNVTFNLSAGGSTETNLSGAVSITGNVLNNSWQDGISINNFAGTISSLTITGNSLTSASAFAAGSAGTAIKVLAQQGASAAAQITGGSISDNTINNFPGGGGIMVHGGSTAALPAVNIGSSGNHFKIDGNVITGFGTGLAGIGTNGIEVTIGHLSSGYFTIGETGHGNTITNVAGNGIAASLFGTGTASYDIGYNTIDANNTAGSAGINTGADSATSNTDTPTLYLNIHNNNVQHTQGAGILSTIRSVDGTGYFKIQNNSVTNLTAPGLQYGIRVDSGNGSEATGAHVILQIDGNTAVGHSNAGGTITDPGIGIRQQHTGVISTLQIVGLAPSPANDAQMEAYVSGQNPGSAAGTFGTGGTASISSGATYTIGVLPVFP